MKLLKNSIRQHIS